MNEMTKIEEWRVANLNRKRMRNSGREVSLKLVVLANRGSSDVVAGQYQLKIQFPAGGGDDEINIFPHQKLETCTPLLFENLSMSFDNMSCVGLDDGNYFLLPAMDIINTNLINSGAVPFIFSPLTNKPILDSLPSKSPKPFPLVAAIGNSVYVLSRCYSSGFGCLLPDPCFEAYNLKTNSWDSLPGPWFYEPDMHEPHMPTVHPQFSYDHLGYVVFQHFIILCLWSMKFDKSACFSYNTISRVWKNVDFSPLPSQHYKDGVNNNYSEDDDDILDDEYYTASDREYYLALERTWHREALVSNGYIYGYQSMTTRIVSFSCTLVSEEEHDLSMGPPIIMDDFKWPPWEPTGTPDSESTTLTLISDDLICLVQTTTSCDYMTKELQPVQVSILRINGCGRCTTLKVFDLSLLQSQEFHHAMLVSCLSLEKWRSYSEILEDPGQKPFTFTIGKGSVIKGWDEGVLGMQLGEVARLRCFPDYAYGAGGFPAWGIQPNSVLDFEIEVLSAE